MSSFFSDLQQEGSKRWYNVVADHKWELDQVAKQYHVRVKVVEHVPHVEVTPQQREKKKYLESKTTRRLSSHEGVVQDNERTSHDSDYFVARRVTNDEREKRPPIKYGTAAAQHFKEEIASVPGSNNYA